MAHITCGRRAGGGRGRKAHLCVCVSVCVCVCARVLKGRDRLACCTLGLFALAIYMVVAAWCILIHNVKTKLCMLGWVSLCLFAGSTGLWPIDAVGFRSHQFRVCTHGRMWLIPHDVKNPPVHMGAK